MLIPYAKIFLQFKNQLAYFKIGQKSDKIRIKIGDNL